MRGEAVQKWHQLNIACSVALLAAGFLLGSWCGRTPSTHLAAAFITAATRPNSRRLSTAVPLEEERLFGPPLARLQLYDKGAALFEPAAYRKCVLVQGQPIADRYASCRGTCAPDYETVAAIETSRYHAVGELSLCAKLSPR